RMGQPDTALVHPVGRAAAHAGELHLLRGGAGDGADSAEPAGSPGAGGQPTADDGLDRALCHRVRDLVRAAAVRAGGAAPPTAALVESGRGGGHGIQPGGAFDFGVTVVDVVSRLAFAGKICAVGVG